MTIKYHKHFEKAFTKLNPKVKEKFLERVKTFQINEFDPSLNNHALTGEYTGFRSINVTGDIRAIYIQTNDDVYRFMLIGSHSQLYD